MYTSIDELKLNRFKVCCCPKPKDLFFRIGSREPKPISSSDEFIPMNMDKIDSLAYLKDYDAYFAERERAGTEAQSHGNNSDDES